MSQMQPTIILLLHVFVLLRLSECRSKHLYVLRLHNTMSVVY